MPKDTVLPIYRVTSENTLSLTLEPVSTHKVQVDTSIVITDKAIITIMPVGGNFVETQKMFSVDFVAKRRRDKYYPKFCECGETICEEGGQDRLDYDAPVAGGNPLIVDFSACANSESMYNGHGYKPVSYEWYFDYGNYGLPTSAKDSYVSGTSPYATYTYCGGYLENYDVKLCVNFAVV